MRINMRDLLILMDCTRMIMRIKNQQTGWDDETIKNTFERVFNEFANVDLKVEKDEGE